MTETSSFLTLKVKEYLAAVSLLQTILFLCEDVDGRIEVAQGPHIAHGP